MSNNSGSDVRNLFAVDPRAARSTHALSGALIELIRERDFDDITVQQILERAGVGRTTFYAHYRNKEDVLYSSYERLFSALEPMLARDDGGAPRLFPVKELLSHVAEMRPLVDGLRAANRLGDVWSMCTEHATRMIESRTRDRTPRGAEAPGRLVARMLAGALVEAMEWWLDHPASATPAEVDAAFHALAWRVLAGP